VARDPAHDAFHYNFVYHGGQMHQLLLGHFIVCFCPRGNPDIFVCVCAKGEDDNEAIRNVQMQRRRFGGHDLIALLD
jgi:hypothetical protein